MRILSRIASSGNDKPVQAQAISKAEEISSDYVEQILSRLKSADLVASHRGINGGFTLAKSPNLISVADVVRALEGDIQIVPCAKSACARIADCTISAVWAKASAALEQVLSETSIQQLAEEIGRKTNNHPLSFEI